MRKYADGPARQRAYRWRYEIRNEISAPGALRYEIRYEIQPPRDEIRNEIPVERPPDAGRNRFRLVPIQHVRDCLAQVAGQGVDPAADVASIGGLIEQGCDLEADVVPTVARST
jgi:hypothetical protein